MTNTKLKRVASGAVSIFVLGAVLGNAQWSAAAPADPHVKTPSSFSGIHDGFNHWIVELAPQAPIQSSADLTDAPIIFHKGEDRHLTADRLKQFPGLKEIAQDSDGNVRAILSGSSVEKTTAGPTTIDATEHSLRSNPQVSSLTKVFGTTYALKTKLTKSQVSVLPGVAKVTKDAVLYPFASNEDPLLNGQWALSNDGGSVQGWTGTQGDDIKALDAQHASQGTGTIVAVIDSGVDVSHPDLTQAIWSNPNEVPGNGIDDNGWNFASSTASVQNAPASEKHGTEVAGIIAATEGNDVGIAGVAPAAKVMPVTVSDGGAFLSSTAAMAIDYAVENGANVINASWGTGPGSDRSSVSALEDAIKRADDAGVIVVTAAGNEGVNIDKSPRFPASLPEANIITVGATDNSDKPLGSSNSGKKSVDLSAPGLFVKSTAPGGFDTISGTSAAAPFVTGSVALLKSLDPKASVRDIKNALLNSAEPVAKLAGKSATGGRLDAAKAENLVNPGVRNSFSGFNSFRPNVAHATKIHTEFAESVAVPVNAPVAFRTTLAIQYDDVVYGVVNHHEDFAYGAKVNSKVTDGLGAAVFSPPGKPTYTKLLASGGADVGFRTALPAGHYALMVQLVNAANANITFGKPSAVVFTVGDAPATTDDVAGSSTPGTSTDGSSVTSTDSSADSMFSDSNLSASAAGNDGTNSTLISTSDPSVAPSDPVTTADGATGLTFVPTISTPTSGTLSPAPTTSVIGGGGTTTSVTTVTALGAPSSSISQTSTSAASVSNSSTLSTPISTSTTTAPSPSTSTAVATTTFPSATPTTTPLSTTTTLKPASTSTTSTTLAPITKTRNFKITNISPRSGSAAGFTSVAIYGEQLPKGAVVSFGAVQAIVTTDLAPTMIIVQTGAHVAGTVSVTVSNKSAKKSDVIANAYTYLPVSSGSGSTTLNGSGTTPSSTTDSTSATDATTTSDLGVSPATSSTGTSTTNSSSSGSSSTTTSSSSTGSTSGSITSTSGSVTSSSSGSTATVSGTTTGGTTTGGKTLRRHFLTLPNGLKLVTLADDHPLVLLGARSYASMAVTISPAEGMIL